MPDGEARMEPLPSAPSRAELDAAARRADEEMYRHGFSGETLEPAPGRSVLLPGVIVNGKRADA